MGYMREEPKEYDIYRHFKGSFYQIVAVAIHTETKEKMVIYRALKNSAHVFARPLSMFMSEVDKNKYPDVDIQYRFTKIEDDEVDITLGEAIDKSIADDVPEIKEDNVKLADNSEPQEANEEVEIEKVETSDDYMDTCKYREDGSLVIDPLVEKVLDEKEFTKKIEAFQLLRNKCDEEMLTQIAISLDIKLTSDTIEGNYAEILKVLRMHEKYESGRLRW